MDTTLRRPQPLSRGAALSTATDGAAAKRQAAARAPLQIRIVAGGEQSTWTLPDDQVWRRSVARRVRTALAPHFGGAPYGEAWAIFAGGTRTLVPLTDSLLKEAHFRGWRLEARRCD